MSEKPVKTLDCRGLSCPMPIMKTKKEIEKISIGQILEIWSSDAGSTEDFPSWAKRTGNELIKMEEKEGYTIFYIKKKS